MGRKSGKKGIVYLIGDADKNLYKIGMTKGTLENRMKELQTGNSTELHVVAYHETDYPFRVESILHNRYHADNVLNEWFELDLDTMVRFNEICNGIEELIECMKDNPYFSRNLR